MESKSLATMKHFDPSTSRVEEHKKESEEKGVLLVTEKDLKGENFDIDGKVTGFDALMAVHHIAYKNLKLEKWNEKQKEDAILGDGKIGRLVRERARKRSADYFKLKMNKRCVGEMLLNSAIKSYALCYREGMEFNLNEPKSHSVYDVLTTRKRGFTSADKNLATMKHFDPSTSMVEEHKKKSEEKDVLLVIEMDLKGGNINIDGKVTDFDVLVVVLHIAFKNLKQVKWDEKQKKDAILGDGNISQLVRERTCKRYVDYFKLKMNKRCAREMLLSFAIKSCAIRYRERMEFNLNEPMSHPVYDVLAIKNRVFTFTEWPFCSTKSYRRDDFR
ncbi:hypothetical protein SADUNF_Sadunf15G0013600 [Salix dunnii]|uniref:Uncharacterized protein n=1 Tax=Salix dunnii TaxID=1413687 RepID=A0A835JC07_9ROSI|nr:hypothetical protein SADUNF_Sadunf15G0013600 [Salix dunnii]